MQQLIQKHSASDSSAVSDRAATAAWKLFDPMHVDAHTQIQGGHSEGAGTSSLVESAASAMCEMGNTVEMAMLWTEVSIPLLPACMHSCPYKPCYRLCACMQLLCMVVS